MTANEPTLPLSM